MGVAKGRRSPGSGRRKLAGMRLIRGGEVLIGAEGFYPEEAPVRRAEVADFWIDARPVTNADFAAFVADTGYVTFAEIPPDPRDYPGMAPDMARPGSAVFTPPEPSPEPSAEHPVDLRQSANWWRFVFGADWRRPEGPLSSVEDRMDHPVVQVAYVDALAYARWAGKSLPTEAEWEHAARGGLVGRAYAWGDELAPGGRMMANYWQGAFPLENTLVDGYARTSPAGVFPPNGYGLYDMIGNVWEWTEDWWSARPADPERGCCGPPRARIATAAESGEIPAASVPRKVLKGGSHLCAANYCQRYRPAARHPQPVDSPASHIGFRCVARRPA